MRIDLEDVPSGTEFESEICVIGAGIAGLILSRRLAAYGFKVNLLEAGGIELEDRSQELYRCEMRGVPHQGTTEGRFRTYGGASTRWGGQLLSYPDEVFRERAIFDHVGWPIAEADVRPYYPEIFRIMGANDLPFTDEFLEPFGTRAAIRSPDVRVRFSKFSPFPRRNLAKTIGRECLASPNVTVFFHANAHSIDLDPSGSRIESVLAGNYGKGRYRFKARQFIVSTGTIETSRLLLSSTSVHAGGLGNQADQVGRYFHDHVTVKALALGPQSKAIFAQYFSPYYIKGTLHNAKLEAAEELQEKLGLPEVMAHFFIHEGESAFGLLRQTLVDLQWGALGAKTIRQFPKLVSGAVQMAYALKVKGRRSISEEANITMNIETEQKPRADSRILISDQRNAVGIPKTIVDWKISLEDGSAMQRYSAIMDRYLRSLGMTQLDWNPGAQDDPQAWVQAGKDILHPMGGTRMGVDPATSVVDRDLRLHGVENVYIASCSTYPSGGSSNPTFTLMALACRLADLLKQKAKK